MATENKLPAFSDPSAGQERFGLDHGYRNSIGLPGCTWAEGNMFDGHVFLPNCDMEGAVFDDAVWSRSQYGKLDLLRHERDQVLAKIFFSNPMRRLQAVEQLTLPPQYSTVPNTAAFSRFEHVWGSVLFVRQMAEKHNIDPDTSIRLQLRTLISDVAHTTGSHLGDWLFQGVGGPEDQHDIELATYLEASGANNILRRHGFDPEDIISSDTPDWVEAPKPDICVDRVDYGLREMNRTNDVAYQQAFSAEDFIITPDGMLAMTNQQRARVYAEAYLLLSEENWGEATHQFVEEMFLLRTKLFYAQGRAPDTWVFRPPPDTGLVLLHDIHPRDLMYVTDPAQMAAFARPSLVGHTLDAVMSSVARYHRQYVWPGKRERINRYMYQFSNDANYNQTLTTGRHEPIDSPMFGSYVSEYPKTLPIGFTVLTPEEAAKSKNSQNIDFVLTPFKQRQIDPLVQSGKGFARLSELDPSYGTRIEERRQKSSRQRIARLAIPDPNTNKLLRDTLEHLDTHWQERLQNSRRMAPNELRALLQAMSGEIHGTYPFMTFFSY